MTGPVLYGDWERARRWTVAMQSPNMMDNLKPELLKLGEAVAEKVKYHIQAQDLSWTPLRKETIHRKGHSLAYLETHEYFNSIVAKVTRESAFSMDVSIWPDGTNSKSDLPLDQIGFWLEYGTPTIPARPLWRQVMLEMESLPEFRQFLDFQDVVGFGS